MKCLGLGSDPCMKNAEVYDEQLITTKISGVQSLSPSFQICGGTEIQARFPQNLHVMF